MAPRSISLKKKKHMKKVPYEGSTRQVIAPKERVRPYYKSALIDAGSLRQKNSKRNGHGARENIWL